MDQQKSYRLPGDIGGPMNIGEGYRWNVPVITYGFERSFVDYFGSNGVAAVENAIQLLNQIPAASQINLSNYPSDAWSVNFTAQALELTDLKSMALSLLLEQMGLTSPERYTYCIRNATGSGTNAAYLVVQRNFHPVTAQPSAYINGNLLSYFVQTYPTSAFGPLSDAFEFTVDPLAAYNTTAAGFDSLPGDFVSNLSQDDVGGLRYLLSGNQVRYEGLPSDVQPMVGTNLIRFAYRPGLEKLTLQRHPVGTLDGAFKPCTNQWTDVFFLGDMPVYQPVRRVTSSPDIIFRAGDLGMMSVDRTGTSNWVNNAELNGNPNGAGPGVIQPPVRITFNNTGIAKYNVPPLNMDEATAISLFAWGTFDSSTNPVVTYPVAQTFFQPTNIRFRLVIAGRTNQWIWAAKGVPYARMNLQTSTNLNSWNTLATFTNSGDNFNYLYLAPTNESARYFRAISE